MKKIIKGSLIFLSVLGAVLVMSGIRQVSASVAALVSSPFVYSFNSSGVLQESGSIDTSSSPYWWVNSGARLIMDGSIGETVQGSLAALDSWRILYSTANPVDTDNGYHPQNIFRLVTRSKWQNASQSVYLKITKDNLSTSSNRNQSNGLLLFNRYLDGSNLYYAGIRVDGAAVIKKKKAGTYYTMAYKNIFPGIYNHSSNPNLIPEQQWIGVRSDVQNNADGSVVIKLYIDVGKRGVWTLVLEARDDGRSFGGSAFTTSGFGGIRTDFMDVQFDDYRLTAL